MKKRTLLYGTNAFIFTVIILAILILVNFLAYKRGKKVDVTEEKLFSLSDQTTKVLKSLDKEIKILAFFKDIGEDRRQFQELIGRYEDASDRIKVEFIEPEKEPGVARKHDINQYATVVLLSGENSIKIKLLDMFSGGIVKNAEEEVTNGIIKISRAFKKTIYFLKGHGERDINDSTNLGGFGFLRKSLDGAGYEVKELLLLREPGGITEGNSILVVAAPQKPLTDGEIGTIKDYLDKGGKALFMIEPRQSPELVGFLKNYGFDIEDNIIVDPQRKLLGTGGGLLVAGGGVDIVVAAYPFHEITKGFDIATLFSYARTVRANAGEGNGFSPKEIAETSEASWAETNFSLFEQGTAEKDPDDKAGPLSIAAVTDGSDGKIRIAVFGDADFVSNRFFDFLGNSDLFLNTVSWLAQEENLISIRPKSGREGRLTLTGNEGEIIFFVTVIIIPALVLFSGVFVWWRRRNL